jgi:phosphotransferase system HPr-like phosphotransfer protein
VPCGNPALSVCEIVRLAVRTGNLLRVKASGEQSVNVLGELFWFFVIPDDIFS